MTDFAEHHGSNRYGFYIGGPDPEPQAGVLIPPAMPSEFVVQVSVYPVPRAPARLRGMTQIRGQAVMVIDTGFQADPQLPVIRQCNLLVLGAGNDAVAFINEHTPRLVRPIPVRSAQDAEIADHWFAAALSAPSMEADRPGLHWWELNVDELINLCLYGGPLTPAAFPPVIEPQERG